MSLVSVFILAAAGLAPQQQAPPVADVRPGTWKMVGPMVASVGRRSSGPGGLASRMAAGSPWSALRGTFDGPGDLELHWTTPDVDLQVTRGEMRITNPRPRRQLDSGALDVAALLHQVAPGITPENDHVVYFYRPVYASSVATIAMTCGMSGTMSLWWNGRRLLRGQSAVEINPDSHRFTVQLHPGLNHLLVEMSAPREGWGFELRSARRMETARINRAIDLGVDYLLDNQLIDGSWAPYGGHVDGSTALAVYTLLKSGERPRSEAVLKGLAFLRLKPAEGTYSVALTAMAFHAAGDPQDDERLAEIAERLVDGQLANGMWSYSRECSKTEGDLSNTQYAALGLRAAAQHGIVIPEKTWASLAQATLRFGYDGGFGYSPGSRRPSLSMTAAGVGTLAICRDYLTKANYGTTTSRVAHAIDKGCDWLGDNWSLGGARPSMNGFYTLYGLERAGGLAERESFGEHAWYDEGASHIVDMQKPSGAWEATPTTITECFALLFLRRATSRHALTNVDFDSASLLHSATEDGPLLLRLSLRPPNSLWIDSRSEDFDAIVRVVYWLKEPASPWRQVECFDGGRFAIQHDFSVPGGWQIRADAQLEDGRLLSSGTISFHQREGLSAERLSYVTEGHGNLAPSGRPQPSASSSADQFLPSCAVDGDYATSWRCSGDDPEPELIIDFRRRRNARQLKLVLAPRSAGETADRPQVAFVEVTVGEEAPRMLRLPDSLQEKAVLDFGRKVAVEHLRLRIVSADGGILGRDVSVGFAEVELY
jgi:hypothetical protein